MESPLNFPKIKSVTPLPEKRLLVIFETGEKKIYDCKPLLDEDMFSALKDDVLFKAVQTERNGYAVIWNDEIDLSEAELWINGAAPE